MRLLVLSARDVRSALSYASCADAMRAVVAARARGQVFQPLRSVLKPDGAAGLIGLMPAYQEGAGFGLKALCIMPGNPAAGLDSHQGIVMLSSPDTGQPLAVLNASAVTEIRTAAVSAVATDLLALPGADVLAPGGTGAPGGAHPLAVAGAAPVAAGPARGSAPAPAPSVSA